MSIPRTWVWSRVKDAVFDAREMERYALEAEQPTVPVFDRGGNIVRRRKRPKWKANMRYRHEHSVRAWLRALEHIWNLE